MCWDFVILNDIGNKSGQPVPIISLCSRIPGLLITCFESVYLYHGFCLLHIHLSWKNMGVLITRWRMACWPSGHKGQSRFIFTWEHWCWSAMKSLFGMTPSPSPLFYPLPLNNYLWPTYLHCGYQNRRTNRRTPVNCSSYPFEGICWSRLLCFAFDCCSASSFLNQYTGS